MLILLACLLPLVASVLVKPPTKNYILDVDNGTVRSVRFVAGDPSPERELDLSDMSLRALAKNALDEVADVESLDLSNNSLTSLPDLVFSNLTKLKRLSLSHNQLSSLRNLFVDLENLRLLNISSNPVRHLRRGDLFGLTKSAKILVDGNILWSVSTDMSINSLLENDELKQLMEQNPEENLERNGEDVDEEIDDAELREQEVSGTISGDTRVKLCKSNSIATSLEIVQQNEELAEGCVLVPIEANEKRMNLREQGIAGFRAGWYQLQFLPVASLDLSSNEITEIGEETLNNLPAHLAHVSLLGNKIRRLRSRVIKNDHLRTLNFKDNLIEEIEEGALAGTKLRGLFLIGNRLESLNFVSTLPDTLTALVLSGNRIISVPQGTHAAFSELSRLLYLNLDDNGIQVLRNNVFRGLRSLQALTLTRNGIATIESAAFEDLMKLRTLDLGRNSIRDLPNDTFARLTALRELNLSWNKLIRASSFSDLPRTLNSLHLDYNEIDALESGSFVRAPRLTLSLTGNRISRVARGAFHLPTLKDLNLNGNQLTTIEGDSYENLGKLRHLWLAGNNITEISKGSCSNLGSLYILDVSRNPFQKLENGAFHGLSTAAGSSLYVYENNLKEMHAGLFDDV